MVVTANFLTMSRRLVAKLATQSRVVISGVLRLSAFVRM